MLSYCRTMKLFPGSVTAGGKLPAYKSTFLNILEAAMYLNLLIL